MRQWKHPAITSQNRVLFLQGVVTQQPLLIDSRQSQCILDLNIEESEFLSYKILRVYSHRTKAESKARDFLDICHCAFDLARFRRAHFRLGWMGRKPHIVYIFK